MEGFRNEPWLALCFALVAGLRCVPVSDDLGAYASEWSPAAAGGASGVLAGGAGAAGDAGDAPPDGGAAAGEMGSGGDDVVLGEGIGRATALPLEGDGGTAGGATAAGGNAAGGSGAPSEPAGACADGVLGPDTTRCYLVSDAIAVWQSARDQCIAWQGALARVDTPEEDQFLASLVSASLWLGASDTVFDNIFVWTDGSPVMFGNWGPGQPDRFPGPDCVEKREGAGRFWFDQPCANARAFVCEKAVTLAP